MKKFIFLLFLCSFANVFANQGQNGAIKGRPPRNNNQTQSHQEKQMNNKQKMSPPMQQDGKGVRARAAMKATNHRAM